MAQKKKSAYQKAIENEEGSGGSGNTSESNSWASNRPKSREKYIGGPHGKLGLDIKTIRKAPPNPKKVTYDTEPLQTTGYHKEPADPTVKKPISRKKRVKGAGTLGPTKSTSGRKS